MEGDSAQGTCCQPAGRAMELRPPTPEPPPAEAQSPRPTDSPNPPMDGSAQRLSGFGAAFLPRDPEPFFHLPEHTRPPPPPVQPRQSAPFPLQCMQLFEAPTTLGRNGHTGAAGSAQTGFRCGSSSSGYHWDSAHVTRSSETQTVETARAASRAHPISSGGRQCALQLRPATPLFSGSSFSAGGRQEPAPEWQASHQDSPRGSGGLSIHQRDRSEGQTCGRFLDI